MKQLFILLNTIIVASCNPAAEKPTPSEVFARGKWIDLTYAFSEETLYWPNNPTGFQLDTQFVGLTAGGYHYESFAFCAPEHGGTHLDAPVHFAEGKWSADQIPVERLMGEAAVIDVSHKAKDDADYRIVVDDVTAWEQIHGEIPDDAIILFRTGWGAYYPDAAKYLGTAAKGQEAVADLHFPGIHPDLATWLIENRKIKAVGIDVASVDYGQSKDFKTHRILYEKNISGFENLANLEALPPTGAYVIAMPMKIKGGSGGPLRIVAWVEGE
jgi:kynurenine formamidase